MNLFSPLVRRLWISEVHGLEHIPRHGSCLVASNHESYFDFFLFVAATDRKIHYLAAEKFFIHPFWKWLMVIMGCIRVDRYSNVNVRAYKEIARVVRQGRLIGIFPEGTRSPDGKLMKGKTGVAHLAIKSGLPIIPVGIRGSYEIMSVRDKRPKLRKASIHIGKPLYFDHLKDMQLDDALLKGTTDSVMLRIAELTGEEYLFAGE
jgi:1-acyl-sn-glycerol-3-phosphate acyltransferase